MRMLEMIMIILYSLLIVNNLNSNSLKEKIVLNSLNSFTDSLDKPIKDTIFKDDLVTIISTKPISKKIENDTLEEIKEWYPFMGWKYNYNKVKFTEKNVEDLTRVLCRESHSNETLSKKIDQYLVMITVMRYCEKKGYKSIDEYFEKGNHFSIPDLKYEKKKNYLQNKEVVLNVLNRNIPDFVPYIPNGATYYWNIDIDTNKRQKEMLEDKCILVASTIKGHCFFAKKDLLEENEKEHLINYINSFNFPNMKMEKEIEFGDLK